LHVKVVKLRMVEEDVEEAGEEVVTGVVGADN
jgi:hypothetical protein